MTVSETLGLGNTEKVAIIRSGYSSLTLFKRRTPSPEPVPPPSAICQYVVRSRKISFWSFLQPGVWYDANPTSLRPFCDLQPANTSTALAPGSLLTHPTSASVSALPRLCSPQDCFDSCACRLPSRQSHATSTASLLSSPVVLDSLSGHLPSELNSQCVNWNPCRLSLFSACCLTTSITVSANSAPSV